MTLLEVKIRTYLIRTENYIDIDTLELIKIATLDDQLNLVIPAKKVESDVYKNYWEKFKVRSDKKSPVEMKDSQAKS